MPVGTHLDLSHLNLKPRMLPVSKEGDGLWLVGTEIKFMEWAGQLVRPLPVLLR